MDVQARVPPADGWPVDDRERVAVGVGVVGQHGEGVVGERGGDRERVVHGIRGDVGAGDDDLLGAVVAPSSSVMHSPGSTWRANARDGSVSGDVTVPRATGAAPSPQSTVAVWVSSAPASVNVTVGLVATRARTGREHGRRQVRHRHDDGVVAAEPVGSQTESV